MNELKPVGVRYRSIRPDTDNSAVQVGRPDQRDVVISALFENQGRNSLVKIKKNGVWLELRPFSGPLEFGVQFPYCLEETFTVIFENENQQQFDAGGNQDALDLNETDITRPDAVYHKLVLAEVYVKKC